MPTTVVHPAKPIDELVGGELHQLEAVLEQIEQRGRDAERASREFRHRCDAFAPGDREQFAAEAREVIADLTAVGLAAARTVGYLDRRAEELDGCRTTMSSPEPIPWRSGTSATLASPSLSTALLTAESSNSI